ncbi:N-acetylmuramoyl-L-alanine amidase [Burkholderia sola]|nr:N-acetylmuramoyl-L-alanine amidase [Burkholderia cenocepacia]CAG2262977.1 N-acetylmuramoyl-L-alanine amidase [Burkholderia cenocepacia]CAG2263078.1 N-acetylmuramoyl-L-alanine amidase [Burkholderia cenocepacia]CAG2263163.1 N-acetylmuramoyl-L-alanine amidase [Burkholderia cenocepacia]CAG2263171.1 N-acetylmuramoyl-L-alanine amidase [Burkholderia cenocepacia]
MYYPDEKTAEPIYESVTTEQNASLKWLVRELSETLNVEMREVYRHPEVGRKNATEASTARWE